MIKDLKEKKSTYLFYKLLTKLGADQLKAGVCSKEAVELCDELVERMEVADQFLNMFTFNTCIECEKPLVKFDRHDFDGSMIRLQMEKPLFFCRLYKALVHEDCVGVNGDHCVGCECMNDELEEVPCQHAIKHRMKDEDLPISKEVNE